MRKWMVLGVLLAAVSMAGCSVKWLPVTQVTVDPPVAYQQEFIADALDDVFATMDFAKLSGEVVEIEVLGVYVDDNIADYCRSKLQLEMAKAGAITETALIERSPTYKCNVVIRYGGVNDFVKSALLYEWRVREYTYDVQVAIFSIEGKDYFVQSGKGAASATISRVLYLLFFPVPLPTTWSQNPGRSLFEQVNQSYNSARMGMQNSRMRWNRANIRATLP